MIDFCMPSLGADMDYGILTEWKVKPGDSVKKGQIIALVETLKGIFEVEVFRDAVVSELIVPEGKEVPVGTVLAKLEEAESESFVPAKNEELRVPASPAVRRKARELGLNISDTAGKVLSVNDLEKIARERSENSSGGMRMAIAKVMSRSKREIPHYYLSHTINLEPVLLYQERLNNLRAIEERLVHTAFLLKAVARALRKFPDFNGFYQDDSFLPAENINIGLAVSLRSGGIIVPAIFNTDQQDVFTLMKELNDLVKRAKSGQLRTGEVSSGTITVTSMGDQGVENVFPVIYPPQVAMLGFGTVLSRPWVSENTIVPCRLLKISLSADHRVTDGHYGARFLLFIEKLLAQPEDL